jgi:adenylate cyclase
VNQQSLPDTERGAANAPEEKLRRSLLVFVSAFMNLAVMLWLAIYWWLGVYFSTNIPLAYQLVSVSSMAYYLKTGKFNVFRFIQLTLFLFVPFVMQWSIGNSIVASGVMLWALLAPVSAVVVSGWRESIPWFTAYMMMTAMSGFFDYFLSGSPQTGIARNTIGLFFALNFAAMSSLIYFLVRYFVLETDKIKGQLAHQHALLAEEQQKSENLLLNILPAHIAQRLKSSQEQIADACSDVTVMFADISNFTRLSELLSPEQVVRMLNTVFSWFDSMTENYGLDKIKTIGDAYMVVGGLTREDHHDHVHHIADMALEMADFLARHPDLARYDIGIHVGIATGPVVAGVIGTKRFSYDLWGDTVNTASRLTDAASQGEIVVDRNTYNRLSRHYLFAPPSAVFIKGKGEMTAYRLIGKGVADHHKDAVQTEAPADYHQDASPLL